MRKRCKGRVGLIFNRIQPSQTTGNTISNHEDETETFFIPKYGYAGNLDFKI